MSEYIDRAFLIVPVESVAIANALAAQADPDSGGDRTFSTCTELSPTGAAPATHRAASTLVKESGRAAIIAAYPQVPGARHYFVSDGWQWDSVLADAGLQTITEELADE